MTGEGEILKAAGRQRFLFSKYNNILLPGTAWRCGAPWLVYAQKSSSGAMQAAIWCDLTVPLALACVTTPMPTQLRVTSPMPTQLRAASVQAKRPV